MATAQISRPASAAAMSILPEKVDTVQESLIFVKRLMAIAVSNITYIRGILPEKAYNTRCIDDLSLKIINNSASCGASQISEWMRGCFDALEKNYLRMMLIAVYLNPQDPNTIFESYTLKFKYTELGPEMDICGHKDKASFTFANTKRATMMLIRKLFVLMEHLDAVPPNASLTMKLFYYDEVTPPNYQPPGFKASNRNAIYFLGDPLTLHVGKVDTRFHTFKVRITVENKQMLGYSGDKDGKVADESVKDNHLPLQQKVLGKAQSWSSTKSNVDQKVPFVKTSMAVKSTIHPCFAQGEIESSTKIDNDKEVGGAEGESQKNLSQDDALLHKTSELSLDNKSKKRSGLSLRNRKRNHDTNAQKTKMEKQTPKVKDQTKKQENVDSQAVRRNPVRATRKRECFQLGNGYTFTTSYSQEEEPPRKLGRNSEPNKPLQPCHPN